MSSQHQSAFSSRLLKQVFRWLPLIVITAIVTASVAFFLTRNRTQNYQTVATLLIGIADQQPNRNDAVNAGQGLARTYARIFSDAQIYQQAATELAIPRVDGSILQSVVSVYAVSGTPLIDIQVTWYKPDEAIRIANHMAGLFVEQRREQSLAGLEPFIGQTIEQRRAVEVALTAIDPDEYDRPKALGLRKEQEQLIVRQQALEAQAAQIVKQIDIASPASTTYPVGTLRSQIILTATLIGAAVALALAILLELVAPTMVNEDVVRKVGLPLPVHLPGSEAKAAVWRELIDRSNSPLAQALRLLPGQLPTEAKTIMLAGLGKYTDASTVAANLAAAYAEEGRRVLLVDANNESPQLSRLLGVAGSTGVQQAPRTDTTTGGTVLTTPIPGVSLLGAVPNTSVVFNPSSFAALLEQFEERFDIVIIELFEPLRHSFASRLIKSVDGVVLVVNSGALSEKLLRPYSTWLQQKMPDRQPTLVLYDGVVEQAGAAGPGQPAPLITTQARSGV